MTEILTPPFTAEAPGLHELPTGGMVHEPQVVIGAIGSRIKTENEVVGTARAAQSDNGEVAPVYSTRRQRVDAERAAEHQERIRQAGGDESIVALNDRIERELDTANDDKWTASGVGVGTGRHAQLSDPVLRSPIEQKAQDIIARIDRQAAAIEKDLGLGDPTAQAEAASPAVKTQEANQPLAQAISAPEQNSVMSPDQRWQAISTELADPNVTEDRAAELRTELANNKEITDFLQDRQNAGLRSAADKANQGSWVERKRIKYFDRKATKTMMSTIEQRSAEEAAEAAKLIAAGDPDMVATNNLLQDVNRQAAERKEGRQTSRMRRIGRAVVGALKPEQAAAARHARRTTGQSSESFTAQELLANIEAGEAADKLTAEDQASIALARQKYLAAGRTEEQWNTHTPYEQLLYADKMARQAVGLVNGRSNAQVVPSDRLAV